MTDKENKSAREMFEELGYEYYQCNRYIEYSKADREEVVILFNSNQTVRLSSINSINIELNKAIQKQIEELNWK